MELRAAFTKRYDHGAAICADFTLPLDNFSITVLFGASGCGKTTLLRCLAGLERPEEGHLRAGKEIWFDGATRRCVPAAQRRVGYVFQDAALFPHLNVTSNIAFGLRRLPIHEKRAKVQTLIALAGLEGLERRHPAELSGGQRQRVALARALAPEPQLLLLDEPFASLDRPGREQLRSALRGMLQERSTPTILVTHDRTEALSLGDHLLLMREGCVHQAGAPEEVLGERPPTEEEPSDGIYVGKA